ncbi:hypothetical protein [Quadrisphaera setariae]|uniref:Alkaline shock response membrane anchor protein AmaP n=1 Tax=Quadrisphaera setariae TaxID=2593304 RepID=A0A5C8ZDE5_9ACTN|nr:hypothetical protein [Quadrisphaera setariae]TXR56115.1 hypothetical protein FMM08_11840 [Quadrisphaera setariae]
MSRRVLGWDRTAAVLVALVLLALGAAAVLWGAGQLTRVWSAAPEQLSTTPLDDVTATSWWRWTSTAAGAVLALLGLWWLLAHLPSTRVGPLRLPGSGRGGRSTVDGSSAVAAAAEVLGELPGVRASSGRLREVRGQVVADMSVTAGPRTDLAALSAGIDGVSSDLARVLGRDDVRSRVRVRIARRDRAAARVR